MIVVSQVEGKSQAEKSDAKYRPTDRLHSSFTASNLEPP